MVNAVRSATGVGPLKTLHLCHTTDRRGAELSTIDLVEKLRVKGLSSRPLAVQPGRSGQQLDIPTLGEHGRTPTAIWKLHRQLPEVDFLIAHGASSLLTSYLASRGSPTSFIYRMIGDPTFWGDVRF